MVVCSILAVTTSRILRAATYLLFVLFGTAGIYFMLNYTFLGAVQLLVYAGGITILYVFSILLTSSQDERAEKLKSSRIFPGLITIVAGLAICLFLILKNQFVAPVFEKGEVPMSVIGQALMGAGKHQYVLPFEVISILLLACIVGGLLIARKR
jgi:NADH-quinone oxidoreductase subunit J